MAATLLVCSICPNHPTFSDTSHLLTHVSSKGHLSNLHKLQVRSHQEISAGHQLAAYSQWYHQYDLGRLLSERMLQKESKKATRRRTATSPKKIKKEIAKNIGHVTSEDQAFAVDPRLQQTPKRPARRSRVVIGSIFQPDHDNSDLDSSPLKQRTKRRARRSLPSPIKRSSSDGTLEMAGQDRLAEIDPALLESPDNSKLKGVFWPGMHLFDAATAEMRRRRNQKKDGSALMQMEKTSKEVQPTEVIYSEAWTSIKQRPITGMVEDSSPLKGESPLPKKPARRKRPALTEVSANVPRHVRRPVKLEQSQANPRRRSLTSLTDRGFPSLPGSSNGTPLVATSRYSPTEDETMEFKLTVGNLVNRKKGGNFTIFHDRGNAHPYQLPPATAGPGEALHLQFAPPQMQSYSTEARPQIPFATPSWLQPEHDQSQTYQSLYLTAGSHDPSYCTHQHLGSSKENDDPWFPRTSHAEQRAKPLGWNHNVATLAPNPYHVNSNFGYDGQVGFSGLPLQDDIFGYSTNPLSVAYQPLQDHLESPFKTSETAGLPVKPFDGDKVSTSPDGTVSERSEPDFDHAVFTTSE